uniref:Polyketide_cyc domain-containing protein n=1 Tax=Syphacia muris TaxID=451379 RepID=A0A0N5AM66_9BILA
MLSAKNVALSAWRNFWNPFGATSRLKEYAERRLVGFTREQMFDVVSNVNEYPNFIPWCRGASVFEVSPNIYLAKLQIGFPPIQESYTSTVTTLKPVFVKSVAEPDNRVFKHLDTTWKFTEGLPNNDKSCVLHFALAFEFRSSLHSTMAHAFFDLVVQTMVYAFLKRAEEKYGPPSLNHFKKTTVLKKIS